MFVPVSLGRRRSCLCMRGRSSAAVWARRWRHSTRTANSVTNEVGELVLTEPLVSMPLFFWNDEDGTRFRESYFDMYEGVWRHGDWVEVTDRGTFVISGRSDSTLKRSGIRMGTSDYYRVIEDMDEVADSLVVDTSGIGDAGRPPAVPRNE